MTRKAIRRSHRARARCFLARPPDSRRAQALQSDSARGCPCRGAGVGNRAQPGWRSEVSSERAEGRMPESERPATRHGQPRAAARFAAVYWAWGCWGRLLDSRHGAETPHDGPDCPRRGRGPRSGLGGLQFAGPPPVARARAQPGAAAAGGAIRPVSSGRHRPVHPPGATQRRHPATGFCRADARG